MVSTGRLGTYLRSTGARAGRGGVSRVKTSFTGNKTMARQVFWIGGLAVLLVAGTAWAGPVNLGRPFDAAGLLPALSGGTTDALAGAIRGYLVKSLPVPLYEKRQDWGRQTPNLRGKMKNDGHWKHIVVYPINPADTLVFDIRNLRNPAPGKAAFTVFVSFDVRGEYEVQHWESGIRLRSSSIRARCRLRTTMQCEATYGLEPGAGLLPDAVFRLRVVKSDVHYDNFVTEHIAGFGGEVAEFLGDTLRSSMKQWHPSLERDLLAKANARIEKSADTKEVRVSLYDLLKKKGWLTPPAGPPAPPPIPVSPAPLAPIEPKWQPVYPEN